MSEPLRTEIAALVGSLFPGARVEPIAGDASTRRFHRIHPPSGPSWIVMDYGAPFEGETDDIRMTGIFEAAGLPVARIRHVAPAAGCLVLEDLGPRTLEAALSQGAVGGEESRDRLYSRAVTLALAVATRGTAALSLSPRASEPALDAGRFRFEMDFFLEHYALGLEAQRALPPGLAPALYGLAEGAASCARPVLCHRDYHSRNLMVRADGSLAMVDIQDARRGPLGYDLASLVHDAYVELGEELAGRLVEDFRSGLPDPPSRDEFHDRLAVIAAQRMIKALGTFGFQAHVLGRHHYLEGVPRTLARLAVLLPSFPATAPVAEQLRAAGLLPS